MIDKELYFRYLADEAARERRRYYNDSTENQMFGAEGVPLQDFIDARISAVPCSQLAMANMGECYDCQHHALYGFGGAFKEHCHKDVYPDSIRRISERPRFCQHRVAIDADFFVRNQGGSVPFHA